MLLLCQACAQCYQSQIHSLGSTRKQWWGWLEAAVPATHFTALAIPVTVLWWLVHVCRGGREGITPPHRVDSALEPLASRSRVWLCRYDSNCVYAASSYLLSSQWLQNQHKSVQNTHLVNVHAHMHQINCPVQIPHWTFALTFICNQHSD